MQKIILTRGYEAWVDDEDYEEVDKYNWYAADGKQTMYARHLFLIDNEPIHLGLHSFIMKPPEGFIVDHKDRNGLNCCRNNLRIASYGLNNVNSIYYNSVGFRGVYRKRDKFYAQVRLGEVRKHCGTWDTAQEAAMAYDLAAIELHGEFAVLNFPVKE